MELLEGIEMVSQPDPSVQSGWADEHDGAAIQGKARYEWERSLLRSGVRPGPNHVLHALLRYAGGKAECWPSNDALALDTGLSVRHVRRHIGELVAAGVIAVEVDRSLRTQRLITFPSHPYAKAMSGSRGDAHVLPAMSEGGTWEVGAGGTPVSSESELRNASSGVSVEEDGGGERFGIQRLVDRSAILAVAAQCCYLPYDTISRLEGCDDLGERVAGDWRSLALAIVATEMGRGSGEVQAVHRTLPHLVRLAGRFRSGAEYPSDKVNSTLDAMLDGTYDAPLNTTGVYRGWPACREDAMSKPQVEAWTRSRLFDIAEQAGGSWDTAYEVIWIEAEKHAIQFGLTAEEAGRRRVWIGDGVTWMREFWDSSEHLYGTPDEAVIEQGVA